MSPLLVTLVAVGLAVTAGPMPRAPIPPPPIVLPVIDDWHYVEHVTPEIAEFAKDVLDSPMGYGELACDAVCGRSLCARVEPHYDASGTGRLRWHRGVSVYEPGAP